jgi:hypothetical protein
MFFLLCEIQGKKGHESKRGTRVEEEREKVEGEEGRERVIEG